MILYGFFYLYVGLTYQILNTIYIFEHLKRRFLCSYIMSIICNRRNYECYDKIDFIVKEVVINLLKINSK